MKKMFHFKMLAMQELIPMPVRVRFAGTLTVQPYKGQSLHLPNEYDSWIYASLCFLPFLP